MTSGAPLVHRCGDEEPRPAGVESRNARLRTIDVHCHMLVPEVDAIVRGTPEQQADAAALLMTFGAASIEVNKAQVANIGPKLTKLDVRLADMDAMGVDVQVISISPVQYCYYLGDPDAAEAVVATANHGIAEACAAHPDRLAGLCTVSLQHPERAAAQLERAVRRDGFKGVEISTHVEGRNVSDRFFDPFWAKADELGTVVFIHPWGTTVGERLSKHYLGNTVGQPMETAIALSNLIFDGTLDRCPGVKIVAAHGGGYLPSYISRSDHAFAVRPEAHGCACTPSSYLKRIWFDSLVYDAVHLRQLIDAAGVSQILIGTDYPFDMGHYDPAGLLGGFDPETRAAIAGGNAATLFGLDAEARRG